MNPANRIASSSPPSADAQCAESRRPVWLRWFGRQHVLAALLALAVVLVFWPAIRQPFMLLDDEDYVTEHPLVPLGLTWTGLGYAFVAKHAGNWHPLTTLSHMLDCQLFGVNPAGHHLMNILLHALNAGLLLVVLHRMTGALWQSGLVAALFALHPLRVESVAWVAERKDVLSGLFWMLTLWAYARYAQKAEARGQRSEVRSQNSAIGAPTSDLRPLASGLRPLPSDLRLPPSGSYWLALLFFACGLLSKPMVVTLPFILLLLDYWPLARWGAGPTAPARDLRRLKALLWEKVPFLVVSVVLSYITLRVQRGAMTSLAVLPVSTRVLNSLLSYSRYLAKLFWPTGLAPIYPYDLSPPRAEVGVAIVLVLAVSLLAFLWRGRFPWFAIGWLWFLGTLVPVIGVVQVGMQACADRYTYLPLVGILVLTVWAGATLAARWPRAARGLRVGAFAVLFAVVVVTRAQLAQWESTEKLMNHAIQVAGQSELARRCLGFELFKKGKLKEAARHFQAGLQYDGNALPAATGLACIYARQGKVAEAERIFRKALALSPDAANHLLLADFLQEQDRLDEATVHYVQALALAPYHAKARNDLGNVHAKQGHWPAAREQYERALKLNPNLAEAHHNLGTLLGILERQTAVPDAAVTFHLREAVRLRPGWVEPMNNLAWRLATHPQAGQRNGAEAVRWAARAVELTRTNEAETLDTLAAAQAETGRFEAAVATARQALELALGAGRTNQATVVSNRLELYRQGQPCREP